MKYDDAGWHSGNDFPEGSPEEYGGTHIALFLKWCFIKGWAGELHTSDEPELVKKVVNSEVSATKFFFDQCDGKLTDEDFNDEGNSFASQYYGDNGLYFDDYSNLFFDLMYEKPESDHDFSQLSEILEQRYASSTLTKQQLKQPKPWWRFW